MNLLAYRYAESLLSIALDKDSVSSYKEQASLIKDSFDEAQVRAFFAACKVSKEEKKELCRSVFEGRVDKYMLNFLYVLIDRGRMVNYDEIFTQFRHLCNDELEIEEGTIESVRPLKEELIRELEEALSKNGRKVELIQKRNASLISGFKIELNNRVIDNSMKNKIAELESSLKGKDGIYGS